MKGGKRKIVNSQIFKKAANLRPWKLKETQDENPADTEGSGEEAPPVEEDEKVLEDELDQQEQQPVIPPPPTQPLSKPKPKQITNMAQLAAMRKQQKKKKWISHTWA